MATILVVDDERQVRTLLRRILETSGYTVIEASNGMEAINLYKAQKPDLVITDMVMPEKEGVESIIELKRFDRDIKIIAISGGGRMGPEEYLHLANKLGARFTFEKPFEVADLLHAVDQMLQE
jgi:CheY-like chemotaxis protein